MAKYTNITSVCTASEDTDSWGSSVREKIVDQIVIGTPGTLKRWITKDRILKTKSIRVLVFDEADQMLLEVQPLHSPFVALLRIYPLSTTSPCCQDPHSVAPSTSRLLRWLIAGWFLG